jgi:hypothetical protein
MKLVKLIVLSVKLILGVCLSLATISAIVSFVQKLWTGKVGGIDDLAAEIAAMAFFAVMAIWAFESALGKKTKPPSEPERDQPGKSAAPQKTASRRCQRTVAEKLERSLYAVLGASLGELAWYGAA